MLCFYIYPNFLHLIPDLISRIQRWHHLSSVEIIWWREGLRDDDRVVDKMEKAAVQWYALTGGGGLRTEQVGVGRELVVGRGVQYGMGRAAVQKGHLTLPDGGGGLVQGGGGGRRGWGEQAGWRRGWEGATWRTHTRTHVHTNKHTSALLHGVKLFVKIHENKRNYSLCSCFIYELNRTDTSRH